MIAATTEPAAGRRWATPAVGRRWATVALAVAALLVVTRVAWPDSAIGEASYLLVTGGAAVAAGLGARRARGDLVALLLAASVGLTFAGDVVFEILTASNGAEPDISVADLGWLGSYGTIAAALLVLLGRDRRSELDGYIDIGAVLVVAILVQWELVLRHLLSDDTLSPMARFVWALYPVIDAVLLALVVRAVLAGLLRGSTAVLVGGGTVCWLVADVAHMLVDGGFAAGLDASWMIGEVLLATATWRAAAVPLAAPAGAEGEAREELGFRHVAVALLPLAVPALIEVIADLQGRDANDLALSLATVLLITLAYLRAGRLVGQGAEARAMVRSQARRASVLAVNSSDAVAIVDQRGRILNESPALGAIAGHPEVPSAGVELLSLVHREDVEIAKALFARCLAAPGETLETEVRIWRGRGQALWVGARVVNLLADPDVGGVVVNLRDITDRKRAEDELTHQAFHDALTGLANRALFTDRVEHALDRSSRTGLQPAVVFLDLDGFKTVNDRLGHGAGDQLLRTVADRLRAAVRASDTVARLGGDEFAVLVEDSAQPRADAEAVAQRVLDAMEEPVSLGDQRMAVSASLGIAAAGDRDATTSSVLRDADVAMYRAKATGKARWVVYDPVMRSTAVEALELELQLVHALDSGQFRLAYQPVVELATGSVVGFEALLRWHHPTLGVIVPDRFLGMAEATGAIVPIGRWVLDEACRTAAGWIRDHPQLGTLGITVNLASPQLASPEVTSHVAHALAAGGLGADALVLEISESALLGNGGRCPVAGQLADLHRLGVRLAVDDFGTGHSSLGSLRQLPVDYLKVDRSFVSAVGDHEAPAVLQALLAVGRTLGVETIAVGVERAAQRQRLHDEGCTYAQGFHFAPPLGEEEVEVLLRGQRSADRCASPTG